MTYCVAMSLDAGMIFASDSRTNAGVDQIARFSKMRVFAKEGQRIIVTLSSGNLSITQNAINLLEVRDDSLLLKISFLIEYKKRMIVIEEKDPIVVPFKDFKVEDWGDGINKVADIL